MEIERIVEGATYQKKHWKEYVGEIQMLSYGDRIMFIRNENGLAEFRLNQNALQQACERLGIRGTVRDFDRDKEFVQKAIERKIEVHQSRRGAEHTMVIYDEENSEAKAIKTTAYKRVYNADLLTLMKDKMDKIDAKHSFINDNYMYLTYGNIGTHHLRDTTDIAKGDVIESGFQLWNSETGNSALGVGQFLKRLACKNGMVSHYAMKPEKKIHRYEELMAWIPQAITNVCNFTAVINDIALAVKSKNAIVKDEIGMKDLLSDLKVKKIHIPYIIDAYNEEPLGKVEGGINGYGVQSAITRYACNTFEKLPFYTNMEQQELMTLGFKLMVR